MMLDYIDDIYWQITANELKFLINNEHLKENHNNLYFLYVLITVLSKVYFVVFFYVPFCIVPKYCFIIIIFS